MALCRDRTKLCVTILWAVWARTTALLSLPSHICMSFTALSYHTHTEFLLSLAPLLTRRLHRLCQRLFKHGKNWKKKKNPQVFCKLSVMLKELQHFSASVFVISRWFTTSQTRAVFWSAPSKVSSWRAFLFWNALQRICNWQRFNLLLVTLLSPPDELGEGLHLILK